MGEIERLMLLQILDQIQEEVDLCSKKIDRCRGVGIPPVAFALWAGRREAYRRVLLLFQPLYDLDI